MIAGEDELSIVGDPVNPHDPVILSNQIILERHFVATRFWLSIHW